MEIEITTKDQKIEVEEVIEKQIKRFGTTASHIILPKKWDKHIAIIAIRSLTGNAMSRWGKEAKKRNKKSGGKHE